VDQINHEEVKKLGGIFSGNVPSTEDRSDQIFHQIASVLIVASFSSILRRADVLSRYIGNILTKYIETNANENSGIGYFSVADRACDTKSETFLQE
jgi:hypothetical protein